jgi:hypothetical protein
MAAEFPLPQEDYSAGMIYLETWGRAPGHLFRWSVHGEDGFGRAFRFSASPSAASSITQRQKFDTA